jgi:hypothetical protein
MVHIQKKYNFSNFSGWRFSVFTICRSVVLRRNTLQNVLTCNQSEIRLRDHRGRDRMVIGFITTYAISAYHNWCCEFESRSGRGVQHYVIKFVSDSRQVCGFLRVLRFPPPKLNWPPRYNWNIVESGIKHHQTNNIT